VEQQVLRKGLCLMSPAAKRGASAAIGALLLYPLVSPAVAQQAGPQPPASAVAQANAPKKAAPKRAAASKSTAAPDKAEGKTDAATAQSHVEAGINALEAGKHDAAVGSLSSALAAGSLPSAQTARALYYRGVAYRKQGKPALAVSDLTSALWLKGALTDQQRADATQQRAGAYRDAGLSDQAPPVVERTAATTSNVTTSSVGQSSQRSAGESESGLGKFFGSLFGGGSTTPAATAAAAPTALQPDGPAPKPWGANTQVQTAVPAVKSPWTATTRLGGP
jgi:tetratricopeptide (TPR) repeat protein